MKPRLFYLVAVEFLCGAFAIAQVPPPPDAPVAPVSESGQAQAPGSHLTPEQLDQLLGPIALYPDALIAIILPASTEPSDVVLAARYLNGGDAAQVDQQPWDDSVRALAHYPDLVKWMDENLTWTKQLGAAFLDQPAEIMKSVQRLRAEARAAGTLVDTPQQQVVAEGEAISIVPAQPDVIYVPYYDPDVVYVRRSDYYPGPYLSFSVGFPVGFWLGYNVDWGHRRIWVVDHRERERFWHDQRDWRRPVFPGPTVVGHDAIRHTWTPNPAVMHAPRPTFNQSHQQIVHPAPISRAAQRPPQPRENAISPSAAVRRDGVPETHDTPRQPSEIRHAIPTRPANLPAPAAGQVQTPAQVQPSTPAPVISRGGRGSQSEEHSEQSPREHREHVAPAGAPNAVPTPGRAIPVPQQPNIPNPPPVPFAPIRTERAPQAAPEPAQASQPKPQPPAQEEEHRRRRESENDRDK